MTGRLPSRTRLRRRRPGESAALKAYALSGMVVSSPPFQFFFFFFFLGGGGKKKKKSKARGVRILAVVGIHLTQVTPIYSVRGGGGLSAESGRVRARFATEDACRCVPGPAAMAGWLSLSAVRRIEGVARPHGAFAVRRLRPPDLGDRGDDLSGHADTADDLVPRDVVRDKPEDRHQCAGLAARAGLGSYQTAWAWLHKLRRAMVRPGRDRLTGQVEVDETFIGVLGAAEGRSTMTKALIVVAAEEEGRGIGRIRMQRMPDASAASLSAFVDDTIAPGSQVHTDGWLGDDRFKAHGYRHRITFLRGNAELAMELMPHVHQ